MIRHACALALLLAACGLSSAAHAGDSSVADDFFRAGSAAFGRRDYRAAAAAFDAADREAPHAAAKYNAARAWELAGELARAADALQRALDAPSGLTAEQSTDARQRLVRLRRRVAHVEVLAPAGTRITVAHIDGAEAPLAFHLAPGEHEVMGRGAHGAQRARRIEARAGDTLTIRWPAADVNVSAPVSVSATPAASIDDTGGAAGASAPDPARAAAERDAGQAGAPGGGPSGMAVGGWVAVGVAAVATGFTIGLGLAALGARDEYADSAHRDADAYDRADSLRTATNIALTTAIVGAATGVTLLLLAPPSSSRSSPSPASGAVSFGAPPLASTARASAWLALGPAGASVRGKF